MKKLIFVSITTIFTLLAALTVSAAQDPSFLYSFIEPLGVTIPYSADARPTPVDASFKFLMVDGTLLKNYKIVTDSGTTLVPARIVSEAMGAIVSWDAAASRVTVKKDGSTINLTVGSTTATVDGVSKTLAAAPRNVNGSVFVPFRFIGEALGAEVGYAEGNYTRPALIWLDSPEFRKQARKSDAETLADAKAVLLSEYELFVPYARDMITSYGMEANALDESMRELKNGLSNLAISRRASCYLLLDCGEHWPERFWVNTITGEIFNLSYENGAHVILTPFRMEQFSLGVLAG